MLALAIFLVTLVLRHLAAQGPRHRLERPRRRRRGARHGRDPPGDIPIVWHIVWDATFTFVALIIISLLLDEAGFFHWAALHIARWGGGRGRRLFPLVVLLGAAIAAVFANDGAALLLTPIVLAILLRLEFKPAAALAFIVACGFVADSTSLPLVISNLVNIVSANFFGIAFGRYAAVMVPVDLVSLAATLVVLWAYFRRDVPPSYAVDQLEAPGRGDPRPAGVQGGVPAAGLLLVAYFVTAPFARAGVGRHLRGALVAAGARRSLVPGGGTPSICARCWPARPGRSCCSASACTSWSTASRTRA